jgi:hypothetical protein
MIGAQLRALAESTDDIGLRVMVSILGPTLTRAMLEVNPDIDAARWNQRWSQIGDPNTTLEADQISRFAQRIEASFPCP